MRPKLTLARKIFLMVLFPLVFQLLLLGAVLVVLERAGQDYAAERHTDTIFGSLIDCLTEMAGTGIFDYLTIATNNDSARQKAIESERRTALESDSLRKFVSDDDDATKEHVEKLFVAYEKIGILISPESNENLPAGNTTVLAKNMLDAYKGTTPIVEQIRSILSEQLESSSARAFSYNEMRRSLDFILKSGIFFSIVISLFLLLFFNWSIRKRLGILTENSLLYAANQPLLPPLKGDDEISNLDQIFRQSARTLEETGRRESIIVDNTANVMFSLDATGRIASINRAVLRLWGYTADECLGARLNKFIASGSNFDPARKLAEIVERKEGSFESRLRKADDSLIDVLWVLRWMEGEQTFAGVAHDISESKHVERITLEFSNLMRSGLQGPLDFIRSVFKEIGDSSALSSKAKLKAISAESGISRLIALLDDFSKIDRLADKTAKPILQTARAQTLMETAVESIKDWAARQNVEPKIVQSDFVVFAEADQIVRVLINLISNAIKFSPAQSVVLISASETPDYVEFVVSDKGPGISEENQARVFEKFKQLEQAHETKSKGTGLGLAICESIVSKHGGEIGVTSDGATGSQFWFRLPKPKDRNSDLFGELFGDS